MSISLIFLKKYFILNGTGHSYTLIDVLNPNPNIISLYGCAKQKKYASYLPFQSRLSPTGH